MYGMHLGKNELFKQRHCLRFSISFLLFFIPHPPTSLPPHLVDHSLPPRRFSSKRWRVFYVWKKCRQKNGVLKKKSVLSLSQNEGGKVYWFLHLIYNCSKNLFYLSSVAMVTSFPISTGQYKLSVYIRSWAIHLSIAQTKTQLFFPLKKINLSNPWKHN